MRNCVERTIFVSFPRKPPREKPVGVYYLHRNQSIDYLSNVSVMFPPSKFQSCCGSLCI